MMPARQLLSSIMSRCLYARGLSNTISSMLSKIRLKPW